MCQSGGVDSPLQEASVSEVITVGLDTAKNFFMRMALMSAAR